MAYRESFETCPRCGAALEDAGDVRACNACRGQWVLETVLAEMVAEMLPPGMVGGLTLVPIEDKSGGTGCPSCGVKMEPVNMYGVEIERCPKQHGVWFDPEELQIALRHAADPARHVDAQGRPMLDMSALPGRVAPPRHPPSPPEPQPPLAPAYAGPLQQGEIAFGIQTQGDVFREVRVRQQVIKIGRHDRCHVRVNDDRVAPAHVLIEVGEAGPVLMDLGGRDGTLVNGTRVVKYTLKSGDQILIGATTLTVTFGGTP